MSVDAGGCAVERHIGLRKATILDPPILSALPELDNWELSGANRQVHWNRGEYPQSGLWVGGRVPGALRFGNDAGGGGTQSASRPHHRSCALQKRRVRL